MAQWSPEQRAAHCRRIAQRGGYATYHKYGKWHMAEIGAAGAATTIQRYGVGYFKGLPRVARWTRQPTFSPAVALKVDLAAGAALAAAD